jgi:exopolysaccharide biosynthesis polyprenyl glycosylphosphotransferase
VNGLNWKRAYSRRLLITDTLVISLSVFCVQLMWFSWGNSNVEFTGNSMSLPVSYFLASLVIMGTWMVLLAAAGSRKVEAVGSGPDEYRRVAKASFLLFAILSAASFLFQIQLARGYVLLALPVGLLLLLLSRWFWRQWLHRERARGKHLSKSVIIGSARSADFIAKKILATPEAGFVVIGAFVGHSPAFSDPSPAFLEKSGVSILGNIRDALEGMRNVGADTLIVASSDDLSPHEVRQLGWELNPERETLVVASNILDVSGPRLHIRPVSGLPLILIEAPTISGFGLTIKRGLDLVVSGVALVLLSPVFLAVAIVTKATSPGGVFFFQERVGLGGAPFTMAKFRTMRADAGGVPPTLDAIPLAKRQGNEVLFKAKNDPRITPSGAWLRRHSVDELPQLLNVLKGTMSLVGPRPPLASEVAQYDDHVKRRFLAKPGMTGLWQVSGRSDLTWEESVRADLMYVENWSLTGDLIIIWRTVQVVVTGKGAY